MCERLSVMHYHIPVTRIWLAEFVFKIPWMPPTQVLQECWSGSPPHPPLQIWTDLGTLGWIGLDHPHPKMQIWTDLGTLGWVGLDHHLPTPTPPPRKFRFGQLLDYVGTGVWRLIAVSPKDPVSFGFMWTNHCSHTYGFSGFAVRLGQIFQGFVNIVM